MLYITTQSKISFLEGHHTNLHGQLSLMDTYILCMWSPKPVEDFFRNKRNDWTI